MRQTLENLVAFIKNPILEKDKNTAFSHRFKTFFNLFIISLTTSFIFTLLMSILEEAEILTTDNHAVEELFKTLSPLHFFMFAVVLAPLIEESVFRGPLTLFKQPKYFKIAFYIFAITFGLVHITNYEMTTKILICSPILIAPQFFAGMYFGFIRVRFGLLWSIALHASYNAFLFLLYLLAKDAVT